MKNLLAAIGLLVVVKKVYEHYCKYTMLKREHAAREVAKS